MASWLAGSPGPSSVHQRKGDAYDTTGQRNQQRGRCATNPPKTNPKNALLQQQQQQQQQQQMQQQQSQDQQQTAVTPTRLTPKPQQQQKNSCSSSSSRKEGASRRSSGTRQQRQQPLLLPLQQQRLQQTQRQQQPHQQQQEQQQDLKHSSEEVELRQEGHGLEIDREGDEDLHSPPVPAGVYEERHHQCSCSSSSNGDTYTPP
ncbi:hypothetical protein ACSSS7_000640 [Eimeria intestinalis]